MSENKETAARPEHRRLFGASEALCFIGLASIFYGCWLIAPAVAFNVVGTVLLVLGIFMAVRG
ncbi:hypothetical protein G6M50_36860 [Agrobacterium rhizogenes]|nr:hypothetical protein [Rhizobium rhizogenes]NTJ83359.1 hypothetical protein [Rhizobium rhizogenes]